MSPSWLASFASWMLVTMSSRMPGIITKNIDAMIARGSQKSRAWRS